MDTETQRSAACCELVHSVARSCGEVRLKVTGSSMLPAIWPGDEITAIRRGYAELQTGEIVLYRRGGRLTAHRIERIAQDHLVTRGDSLLSSDPPVQPCEIVGRVVSILRNGHSIRPKHTPEGRIVSLILSRSNFSRRLALYLFRHLAHRHGRPLQRSGDMQVTWGNS
jgi:signal peptidase I